MIRLAQPSSGQRVAVIGAGISGLTAAWLLDGDHEVTIFEAGHYAGGHTHTVAVEMEDGHYDVDTGFIVFNALNYPNFCRLLHRLGIEGKPTSMSFSVRCDRSGLEYNGTSLNRLFAQRRNLFNWRFHRMVRDILRFHRDAAVLAEQGDAKTTVEAFLEERGYAPELGDHYLVPMGSALWSCPAGTFRRFPIGFVARFMANHRMLDLRGRPQWMVIPGGSHQYVRRLVSGLRGSLHLSCPVRSIRRGPDGVTIALADGQTARFDHVIVACHADQALSLLADADATEREVLSAFPYQANSAVLHTDPAALPRRRLAWGSWNYHVRGDRAEHATVTYNMSMLQSLPGPHVFCVTLNDDQTIDPSRILGRYTYHHPVYAAGRIGAQSRHHELIGVNRTSFCGAYWGYGFHEDGVNSALAVAAAFGKTL